MTQVREMRRHQACLVLIFSLSLLVNAHIIDTGEEDESRVRASADSVAEDSLSTVPISIAKPPLLKYAADADTYVPPLERATSLDSQTPKAKSASEIFSVAIQKALGGGRQGATAGLVQVLSMMWLRTTMNYQYRYGASTGDALRDLWRQGGVRRFYKGISFALLQGPLARFGSTAVNEGMLAITSELGLESTIALSFATVLASIAAGAWRLIIIPVDTCKTILQVEGQSGFVNLMRRLRRGRLDLLYVGAYASALATAVGHFPWFATFNALNSIMHIPDTLGLQLFRNAMIGLSASVVSDISTNWIRVIKTTKQVTSRVDGEPMSYREVLTIVLAQGGDQHFDAKKRRTLPSSSAVDYAPFLNGRAVRSLLFRGLGTRILANGAQSMVFTVVWRYLLERKKIIHGSESDNAHSKSGESSTVGPSDEK